MSEDPFYDERSSRDSHTVRLAYVRLDERRTPPFMPWLWRGLAALSLLAAIMWFVVVTAGYALILPGLLFHLFSIMSAAASAHRLNASSRMLLAA